MASQSLPASLSAYMETRVDVEPVGQGPVVQIQLPSSSAFSRASRPQRRVLSSSAVCHNEESYTRSCLATASSIYSSKLRRYPRSFLWRVLDNSKVLEVRSVDLSKHDRETREATVVLQFVFPTPIRKGCVALADDGHDLLSVFVVTKSNELCTLAIHTTFFCDAGASEEDVGSWFDTFSPPTFKLSNPHRLVTGSPEQLVATLDDGQILKLKRVAGQNKSPWEYLSCGGGKWGSSLRGLIRWQGANSIRYNGAVLDPATAIAAEFSPSRNHLITVCVNHNLKIWNLAKGLVVFSMDLLGQEREPQDIPKVLLDAGNLDILRVFEHEAAIEGDEYYAITYSPHEGGQFKIWAIRDADQGNLGVRFLYPDNILRPPDPEASPESKAIWKLADFKLGRLSRDSGMEIWVMMRSGRRFKIYSLRFDFTDSHVAWSNEWTLTVQSTVEQQSLPRINPPDSEDSPELWLEYLLFPGRHSLAILETALSMYCSTRKITDVMEAKASLQDRMISAVAACVNAQHLKPEEENGTRFDQYREALQQEWIFLYQEVQDLERLSWQALALAFDQASNMSWSIFTGGCAVIRDCSRLEKLYQNPPALLQNSLDVFEASSIEDGPRLEPKLPHELAILIQGAAGFRAAFNPSFIKTCLSWLSSELWREPLHSVPQRMETYYDRCGFAEGITDSGITSLREALVPVDDFKGLTTDLFLAVINEMPRVMMTETPALIFSRFGRKVLVKGAQDMIELHARILIDLLLLVVFIEVEVEKDLTELDTSMVFMALIQQLKRYELMEWLAKSVWTESKGYQQASGDETHNNPRKEVGLSILETLFAGDVKPQAFGQQAQTASLSDTIQDLLVWTTGGDGPVMALDKVLVNVQCNLLKGNDCDLASDFLSFQPSTAWAVYITGRYHLPRGEITEAASCFQKAAYQLASKSSIDYHAASAAFLSPAEAAHFGQGLPLFYQHIHQLFDSASYHSYAAHFAQLALQFTSQVASLEPPVSLLTSLFNASLQTSDTSTAFTALTRLPSHDQTNLLPALVKTLLATHNGTKQLLNLPWPPHILPAVDAYLANDNVSLVKRIDKPSISAERQRKMLAAWRLKHGDFRGAATALYSQMQMKQKQTHKSSVVPRFRLGNAGGGGGEEMGSRNLDESYLTVINLLACTGNDADDSGGEAWLLSAANGRKRKVVTIDDVRKGWQKELDRRSVVEGGRWEFGLGDGDEMELG
ncbi:MAG: hypothetical protein Q9185_004360 [Variospora sp. 1 TL-2023]